MNRQTAVRPQRPGTPPPTAPPPGRRALTRNPVPDPQPQGVVQWEHVQADFAVGVGVYSDQVVAEVDGVLQNFYEKSAGDPEVFSRMLSDTIVGIAEELGQPPEGQTDCTYEDDHDRSMLIAGLALAQIGLVEAIRRDLDREVPLWVH
jgi:hypothetical protein